MVFLLLMFGGTYFYFSFLQPIEKFHPTGSFTIGASNFDFSFSSKIAEEPRKLNIRTWYPSYAVEGELNPLTSLQTSQALLKIFGMPEFLAEEENSLAFKNASIAEGQFPVIIFNHGFASFAEQNTSNMQELASNGYIVMSISHPGTSLVTEYTDGTSIPYDQEHPAFVQFAELDKFSKLSAQAMVAALTDTANSTNYSEYWAAMRTLSRSVALEEMQPILLQWIEDSNALIDAIAQVSGNRIPEEFHTMMDVTNIGIMGHSLGGIAATASSLVNRNIKAVINLDAPFAFDIAEVETMLTTPTCFMMAGETAVGGQVLALGNINRPMLENSKQGGCNAVFYGARHMNFSDLNYVSFLKLLPILGSVDQVAFGQELNRSILYFFDRHLKGADLPYIPLHSDLVDYQEY